jgi:hypothetical protein
LFLLKYGVNIDVMEWAYIHLLIRVTILNTSTLISVQIAVIGSSLFLTSLISEQNGLFKLLCLRIGLQLLMIMKKRKKINHSEMN